MNSVMPSSPHLHKRLRRQLFLYGLLAFAFCCFATYHTVAEDIPIIFALSGFLIGGIAGIIFSRMLHISWDKDAGKVIGRFDAVGFALLTAYIIFEVYRTRLVALFVNGPAVLVTSLALLAGIMVGRVIGIRGKVREVLQEQSIVD